MEIINLEKREMVPLTYEENNLYTYFVLNQLAIEFKGEINCIGDNTEKCITFSVPIKKECDNNKTITYKLKFIDSFRFMPFHYQNLLITHLEFLIV